MKSMAGNMIRPVVCIDYGYYKHKTEAYKAFGFMLFLENL